MSGRTRVALAELGAGRFDIEIGPPAAMLWTKRLTSYPRRGGPSMSILGYTRIHGRFARTSHSHMRRTSWSLPTEAQRARRVQWGGTSRTSGRTPRGDL